MGTFSLNGLGVSVGANLGVSDFCSAVLGVSAGANLNVSDFCSAVLVSVLVPTWASQFFAQRFWSQCWCQLEHLSYPETGLPNTNNALEGLFSDLKSKVRVHSGISKEHRKKLLDEYIKRHY